MVGLDVLKVFFNLVDSMILCGRYTSHNMISSFYSFLAMLRLNEIAKCLELCTSELSTGSAFKTHRYLKNTIVVTLLNFIIKSPIPRGRLLQCTYKSIYVFVIPPKACLSLQNSSPKAG